jgi:ABC-type sugar transport system ATPase subunit
VSAATPIFEVFHLRKSYGSVSALVDAIFGVAAGEVHALLGENGAGKSTLIRIAAGLAVPDGGDVRLAGSAYAPASPLDAIRHGVRVVSQEFALAPNISVMENLCLGSPGFLAENARHGRFRWRAGRAFAQDRLHAAGVSIEVDAAVGDLSISERQLVALVRGTLDDPKIVFMDEPSSALDQEGIECLYRLVRNLREAGVAVVYVSHKLEEVFDLSDRLTIMRDGRTVLAGALTAETKMDAAIATMVGRDITQLFPTRPASVESRTVLDVRKLTAPRVHQVDLHVRGGEILGLGGLVGAGRTDLAKAIAGLAPITSGEIQVDGTTLRINNRRDALRAGIEYMTEDRLGEGLVVNRPIHENVTARVLKRFSRGPFVNHAAVAAFATSQIEEFSIVAPDANVDVGTLSGGNQQKTLLASALASDPRVVFFDEPTRGIDVGAKAQIYAMIRELSRDRAVVLISAELIELLGLADRILMMRAGRIAGEFDPRTATEHDLVSAALGH